MLNRCKFFPGGKFTLNPDLVNNLTSHEVLFPLGLHWPGKTRVALVKRCFHHGLLLVVLTYSA